MTTVTANANRDAHVLSPDIIDVAKRPTMVFRSTRIAHAVVLKVVLDLQLLEPAS
jgi:polyisoprenoid-binding protein YceI